MTTQVGTELWCSGCGHRFVHTGDKPPICCPECGGNCMVPADGAELCSFNEERGCGRPAVDPSEGLHMCNGCGTAYMHGF